MAPLSLKIVLDEGAVTRTLMFDTTTNILQAHRIVREKILTLDPDKEYGFFLTSADSECSGIWLNENRPLEYYMLRDGDSLLYLPKLRNLKIRMLDGSVKTLQIDESQRIEDLMAVICEKIGTSNYEEYGLCHEETKPDEEAKPITGTLTLKRKTIQREKDAQLQEMSKKLKTDDNVEWLDHNKTLRELKVDPKETLLFKRRLFYSDRNVDSRDPVQLNLLYVQTREAILDGRQVVTEDKAVEFAGIQCQVQYGDFQEDKHKPGFIENLKEFLPEQYACSWGIEKKIFKIHGKYHGLSQIEAKHLYTKTARELPTYGVTFFLVKEQQKGKKKLVPRLLGINSESILRLDEETKEILQVWLLTQVKSYTAGTESFSLNFGDYSDKNYVVKTNEAIRIKDILEGYIDIIRKKLAAPYSVIPVEGEAICEDMVTSSKGAIIQNVVPSKVQEISYVGPSKIISVEQGQNSQQGTQIVSVQQMITSMQGNMSQKAMRGEIGMRSNMPPEFEKRLNHLNSESVKTVDLLSNPTMANIQQVRKIVDNMEDSMPGIIKGIKEYAGTLHGDGSKRLLEEFDELCTYINILITTTGKSDLANPDNLMTAQDAARKVADLSTQMCFSMDPQVKKRRTLISQARKSFIQDEKTEASLRRASFIHAADNAYLAVEQAQEDMEQDYHGPSLNDDEIRRLEYRAFNKMGKLNAAIALLLNAHADPKNIDYEMAINSMKTITEEMPKLVKDAKSLSTAGDKSSGKILREQISQLLKRTGTMCKLTGSHDINSMQDEGNGYADLAKKLIYTFGRSYRKPNEQLNHDDEHKIVGLVMEVEEKASTVLSAVKELAALEVNDPRTNDLKAAGVKYVDAVHGLIICAKLTAPSIQEPHCQSALTASIANLTSAADNLAVNWKSLIEKPNRHYFAKQLHDYSLDLAKALDNFKGAYSNFNDTKEEVDKSDVPEPNIQQQRRLKFIASTALARDAFTGADKELQEIMRLPPTKTNSIANPEAQRMLSDKLAQLNAAIASLLQATDDDSPDYEAAEASVKTISELTPHIIKNSKFIQGGLSENSWNTIIENLKDMLEATRDICDSSEGNNIQDMNNAASKFANASGKLVYVFNPRKHPKKEREIIDLSRNALQDTSRILSNVYALAEAIGGDLGQTLDDAGVKVVDAAQRLLTTAEITAPSIDDKICQATLLSAIDRLNGCTNKLDESWQPVLQMPQHCQALEQLNHDKRCIQNKLDILRKSCEDVTGINDIITKANENEDELKKIERINFIATKSAAKNVIIDADKKLDDMLRMPVTANPKSKSGINSNNSEVKQLAQKLADLNAAIAALINSDPENPDYNIGASEINNICKLTPDIIKDIENLHGTTDETTWKEIVTHLKDLLDATQGICDNSQEVDNANIIDAASKFANCSRKLTYVFNPRKNPKKEEQIIDLSKSVVEKTSQMLPNIHQLAKSMGKEDGKKLNDGGIKISDTTQKLLKTAEITAPNIGDARCQASLLSAVDNLSAHLRTLDNTYLPLVKSPENQQIGNKLVHDLKSIQVALDKLKDACLDSTENNDPVYKDEREGKKLKFITTKRDAKNSLINADKKLDDIIKQSSSKAMQGKINKTRPDIENHINKKLSELNSAIATLLQATYDQENPDYENAEASIHTVNKVMPDIIKEMEYLSGNETENAWKKIADELKFMLEALKDVCDGSEDATEMNDAASKFANSSGKLVYLFNPRKNTKAEKQIIDLSRSAVEQTSQMLSNIYQFEEVIENEDGLKLDDAGVKVVDVAQQLLKTAEITAPTIEDARCQRALMSAIEHFSDHLRDLENTWIPLVQSPQNKKTGSNFDRDLKSIQIDLDKLKNACLDSSDINKAYNKEKEKKRITFITKKSTAEKSLIDADKKLDDILKQSFTKTSKGDMEKPNTESQNNISEKLAKLNAAIATLLQATSDRENPHYEIGETAINTINEVIPDIVKEMERSYGYANENSQKQMIEQLKVIFQATRDVCDDSIGDKEMYDASSKFANASGKLIFILNPRKTTQKEQQIIDLSKCATEQTSQILSHIYQLAENTQSDESKKLDEAGVKVAEFSQQLLTTAELTAPSIVDTDCQAALLTAIDHLTNSLQVLENTWNPIVEAPEYRYTGDQLNSGLKSVQISLNKLRKACLDESGVEEDQEIQFRRFLATAEGAKKAMLETENELKDMKTVPLKSIDKAEVPALKRSLVQRLALLNASIASLIQSTSDPDRPDYNTATRSIYTISQLTPDIIKDSHSLKSAIGRNSWKTIDDNLYDIVNATQKICEHIEKNNPKEANEAAYRCASKVGRLSYMFAPPVSTRKENKIMDLSRAAAEQTSLMLSDVYQFADKIGGEKGKILNNVRVKVDNASQMLKRNAEILAPSISDPYCQETLVSSVDELNKLSDELKSVWGPLVQTPQHHQTGVQLDDKLKHVHVTLGELKKACHSDESDVSCHRHIDVKVAKEKIKQAEKFFDEDKMVELRANYDQNKESGTEHKPVLTQRIQISDKLSSLNEAIAFILQSMLDLENIDIQDVEKSVQAVANLTPEIVKETIVLQRNVDDKSREILFEETKALCTSSQAMCDAIEKFNMEDLNSAATQYAQSSRKLHYIISPRTYPNKEKKILDTSRSVCERVSLMLSRVSRLAQSIEQEKGIELDTSGAKVATAAQVFLSTAQITAPSINERKSQLALTSTADTLSKHAQDLKELWMPVALRPEHKAIQEQLNRDLRLFLSEIEKLKDACHDDKEDLTAADLQQTSVKSKPNQSQVENIDNLLDTIQKNVSVSKMSGTDKTAERLVIEDNPLRQLASKILGSVTANIDPKDISTNEQRERLAFSKELEGAIKYFDIANAKCRREPLDTIKRQDLENAIINLQHTCLLSRRKNADQSNIVDVMDYLNDVISSADDLYKTAAEVKIQQGKETLMDIQNTCANIQKNANKLLYREDEQMDGNIIDDMLKFDQFVKDSDTKLRDINSAISKINDENARRVVKDKHETLSNCCDMLRFATNSSISSATSAILDEGLQNLQDVERKLAIILKPIEKIEYGIDQSINKSAIQIEQTKLATVVAAGDENQLPKALVQYAVQMRGLGADDKKYRLKDHLQRLLDLLKTKTVTTSRRVATWQNVNDAENAAAIENVLEELKKFAHDVASQSQEHSKKGSPTQVEIIKDSDVKNLLTPNTATETGDKEVLCNKFYQQLHKLNSMSGTIALSLHKPESLSRSLHTTAETAAHLAAIARGLKSEDLVKNKRIEEAIQEMNIATYNVLKTSESNCHSPNDPNSRRRLLESCRLLNEAISKLAHATVEDKTKNDCDEMNRYLQLQQIFVQADTPTCGLSFPECLDALNSQNDVIQKLKAKTPISRTEVNTSLRYVTSAVCNSAEFGAQTAYLLSIPDTDKIVAKQGPVDLLRLYKLTDSIESTCLQIICAGPGEESTELRNSLRNLVQQLQETINESSAKVKEDNKHPLIVNAEELKSSLKAIQDGTCVPTMKEQDFILKTMKHIDDIRKINNIISKTPQPAIDKDPKKTKMATEVIDNTKSLITSTSLMVKKASYSEEEQMTWVTFGSEDVIKAFEALVTCIREKGIQAGILESSKSKEEQDGPVKSYVQTQVDLANSWLRRSTSRENERDAGVKAIEHIVNLSEQMCEDLAGGEKDEMKNIIVETKELLDDCTVKYNNAKAKLLMERLKELRKMLEKGVVTRVVEDFLVENPLADFDTVVRSEKDVRKRKFLLEKKLAELLVQLGRVKKTARFVADTGSGPRHELAQITDQVELLAPALVKSAQQRIESPNDKDTIEHYEKLLHQYAESLSKVRELCDQAIDPIDFAQAAGETMHRIKEESAISNDPQKTVHTSKLILRLGDRVVKAGMKSTLVQQDPELKDTLAKIEQTVSSKYADTKRTDWHDVMAEIMRKTGEVESALGGENIFLKKVEPDQPIYAAALDLHAVVREWSARDNEIVAVAKRMAVLMARLSDYMNTENKSALLHTSKAIVSESWEVASLARKLALECTDMRIRTNLLQVCERIPTISGQLKMLTTVKGASFGQGYKEDKEAMNMLVGNAQNLMISVQEVVKATASASVQIMSQRGRRMKWIRRSYYY